MSLGEKIFGRVKEDGPLIGVLQTHPSVAFSELVALTGYDFLVIDAEHGWFEDMDILHALHATQASGILRMARLREPGLAMVGRLMDMGVEMILAPNVSTAEGARALARAMIYPPAGTRGFGAAAHRASQYGLELEAHMASPRSNCLLGVMIESVEGVSQIEEIVSVDGVDAVFIGPADLSAALGCPGSYSSAIYTDALAQIERAVAAAGKLLGGGAHPGFSAAALAARSYAFLLAGYDIPMIRDALRTKRDAMREALADRC